MDQRKSKQYINKIKVYGVVQGVGFRPFVYNLAKKYHITGSVQNTGGIVEIITKTTKGTLSSFLSELRGSSGQEYEITKVEVEEIEIIEVTKENEIKENEIKENETETKENEIRGNIKKVKETKENKIKEYEKKESELKKIIDVSRGLAEKRILNLEKVDTDLPDISKTDFSKFRILESAKIKVVSNLPVDLPICNKCASELLDNTNRRFGNPFISCALCGPRYTIMEELPYDRHTTVMTDFQMCEQCKAEYTDPHNRRFHAQTICCDDCGPELIYEDLSVDAECEKLQARETSFFIAELQEVEPRISMFPKAEVQKLVLQKAELQKAELQKAELQKAELQKAVLPKATLLKAALSKACDRIRSGGIIAVKGIGGYQFVCSPFATDTILNLRKLKGREEKPFAVMFENIDSIREYALVSPEEEDLLKSKARPIVLLRYPVQKLSKEVTRESIYIGAFLPYTPLQILLLKELGPLIMTSANLSGSPIIIEDETIFGFESPYLNGVLYHKRRIVRSVDDSVVKVVNQKPQYIRRSRGYVPAPISLPFINKGRSIVGAGGDLKATFCLYKGGSAVVSQYFGDLEEYSVLEEYKNSYTDLSKMLHINPEYAVCDLHPNYHSGKFIKSLGIPVKYVQHHHAHIASVMAEHHIDGKVIGVAYDGTGYGTDGNVWGGEFLICEGSEFSRGGHLAYNTYIGGDDSMKDAKKTATCLLLHAGLKDNIEDDKLGIVKAALDNKVNTILSSSMGRLFDAVSSILNICHRNKYEGECAILLENEALLAKEQKIEPVTLNFSIEENQDGIKIGYKALFSDLVKYKESKDAKELALGFHYAVADMTMSVCEILRKKERTNKVALGGGVFQNAILLELTYNKLLENGFLVYTNKQLPPNDSSISLGQVHLALMDTKLV